MLNASLESEITYQKERARQIDEIVGTSNHVVERYRHHRLWRLFPKEFIFKSLGELKEKSVLDFGCGEGRMAAQMALLGARVTGIDISPELIELAKRRAGLDRVDRRVEFRAENILESSPAEEAFDFIVCTDALHHVDLSRVVPILWRCLKPGGKLIAKEPVSLSKSFQAFRDRLPIKKVASPGDRQLTVEHLENIQRIFSTCEITHFNLFGRFSRFFKNANRIDQGHPITKTALIGLLGLDWIIARMCPALQRFYGEVVVVAHKAAEIEFHHPS
jgi:SAM-dependent methyltransferase